jgi:hypothetical protein
MEMAETDAEIEESHGSGAPLRIVGSEVPTLRAYQGVNRPIRIVAPGDLLDKLHRIVPSWPHATLGATTGGVGWDIRVVQRSEGYFIECDAFPDGYARAGDLGETTTLFAQALLGCAVDQADDLLAPHAAASLIKGRLHLFLGDTMAGKSTLVVRLALLGHAAFSDDRTILQFGPTMQAIALGCAPKLRLPLPPEDGAALADFVASRRGLSDGASCRVDLSSTEMVRFGTRCPVEAIVLLRRGSPPARASLAPASAGRIVAALLESAFAPGRRVNDLLKQIAGFATAATGHVLTFSDSAEAARLLADR